MASLPSKHIKFETRPEKPESESVISAWLPTSGQKSHGKLAISLSSRSGTRRDHLMPEQALELADFIYDVFGKDKK